MSLSEHDRRILAEIEKELAVDEPRLQQAMAGGCLPGFRRSTVAAHGNRWQLTWVVAMLASLIAGVALLTAGLTFHQLVMVWIGIPLSQFSPVAVAYFRARKQRSPLRRQPASPPGSWKPGTGR